MKKIFLSAFVLALSLNTYSQSKPNRWAFTLPIDSLTQKVDFQGIEKVDGVSKDDLYTRCREWFAKTFVSAQAVIQMDDKQAGKIIGKGVYRGSYIVLLTTVNYTLYYTVGVTIKDGRYRYEVSDFMAQPDPDRYTANPLKFPIDPIALDPKNKNDKGEYKGMMKNYLEATNLQGISLSTSLKQAMAQNATGFKNKDDF